MLLTKLKIATAVLLVVLAFGMGGFGMRWFRQAPQAAQGQEQINPPRTLPGRKADKPKTDQDLIQGTWLYVSLMVGGKKEWNKDAPPKSLTFTGDKVRFLGVNGDGKEVAFHSRFKLDPSRKPREIDLVDLDGARKGKTTACLYELDGNTLRLCHADRPGGDRPRTLESKEGSTDYVWTLKRSKEKLKPVKENKKPADQPVKQKEGQALPTVVSGIVKTVNARSNSLTVTHREGETTFSVAKNADIQIDGKRGELAALPAGASVHLRQFVDAKTTRSVQAEGRWFWGVVKAVDAVNNTITYGDKAQDGAAGKTFIVPKDLVVSIDGKPGKLAGIPAGASANLNLYVDQTTVRSLTAEGAQVNGLAKAVDVKRRTITINDTTYPVAPDAHIGIDHKPGKLEGVPAGANVSLNLQVDQKTVLRISAGGSSIFGTVKSVDVRNNTITVSGHPGDRTFNVPANTHIVIDGKPGTLAGIPAGAGLHALNLRVDQQTAHGINVIGPGYHHVPVKAVDAQRNTITIDDKAPAEVAGKILAVAADANIEIDGKPGKLAGIPAGAFVNLGLSVDAQTARNLQAEGPNLGGCGGSPLTAVDIEKNTITFDDKGAAEVTGKTFTVAKDASIAIDGKPGKLAELPTGSFVNLTLTVDQQAVRCLGAQGPRVAGVVKAVDAAKNTITVDDVSYMVAKDATIVIDGRQGSLADLPTGANVNLNLRVDQKTIGMIQTNAP